MFRDLRRAYQVVFFALFVALVVLATPALIAGYLVEWFLALDPLAALTTALASGTLYGALGWAVALLVLTLVFGRFFCGWICPFGTLHHFVGWVGRLRRVRDRVAQNAPRPAYRLKYLLLVALLVMAALGTTQAGLLDPIAFSWRAFATVLVPAASNVAGGVYQGERHFHFGTLIAALFAAALALNLAVPRLYCRLLCPLGALLGLASRFALFRLRRRVELCKDCNVCGAACQGAAFPHGAVRAGECMLCLNCQEGCPRGAMTYGFSPSRAGDDLDLGRRRTLVALVSGLAAVPLLRASDGVGPRAHPERIRPPGALDEEEFLGRCLKCGVCMKVCPTAALQPALYQAGLEGLWTPVLIPRLGYCEQGCVLCGEVCPTGAIRRLTLAEKIGRAPHDEPVRIGTAFFDRGRCLPWASDTPCIVCEEVCPTSPKAIYFKREEVVTREGERRVLERPFVDLARCTGCGICETQCPVADRAAIQVSSVGESRSRRNRIVITEGRL